MTSITEAAITQLRQLPEENRNRMAQEILDRIAEEKKWDEVVSSPGSLIWLEQQADKIRGAANQKQGHTQETAPYPDRV